MVYRLCRKCKKIIGYNKSYCDKCFEIVEQNKLEFKKKRDKKYNANRDPKYKQFYNSKEWKTLSYKKMQNCNYMCEYEGCKRLATEVHHKIPISIDWDKRLNYDNLMCLCINHHNLVHKRFGRR